MKLTELDPRWIGDVDRKGLGLHFLCPCCKKTRIGIYFKNPVDGGTPSDEKYTWTRVGNDFETLTLTPSVNASKRGHWHGHITGGVIC